MDVKKRLQDGYMGIFIQYIDVFWVELSFSVLYGCYTITSLLRQENEKKKKTNKVDNINGLNGKGAGLYMCTLL